MTKVKRKGSGWGLKGQWSSPVKLIFFFQVKMGFLPTETFFNFLSFTLSNYFGKEANDFLW